MTPPVMTSVIAETRAEVSHAVRSAPVDRRMNNGTSQPRLLPLQTTHSARKPFRRARRVFYFVHMNTVYAHMKQQLLLYRSNDKFL